MAFLYGRKISKKEILQHIGDISQIAGLKQYEFTSGTAKGVGAVDFRTGSGFNFTILLDRAMDISQADYCGTPLCWRSGTGEVSPSFFEPEGMGFLRSCFGGMNITCGLSNVGSPNSDKGEELGLHGRISNIPATNIQVSQYWEKDDFIMSVQGEIRETSVFGSNLLLTRKISTKLGHSKLLIEDSVENQGFEKSPLMLLYHINIGYPVLDENSRLISPTLQIQPRDVVAEEGKEKYHSFQKPTAGYREKCYYHDMKPDKKGIVHAAIVNPTYNKGQGIGVYIKYPKKNLHRFNQWKMMGKGTYVCGLEPANCSVEGRSKDRMLRKLVFIQPGKKIDFSVEIGVLRDRKEINLFKKIATIK